MRETWRLWTSGDGHRVQELRRAFVVPASFLLAIATFAAILALVRGADLLPAGVCAGAFIAATLWTARGSLGSALAGLTLVGALAALFIGPASDGETHVITTVAPGVAIAILVITLRPVVAGSTTALMQIAANQAARLSGQTPISRIDGTVLGLAFTISGVAFISVLLGVARRTDDLAARSRAAEVHASKQQAQEVAAQRVRWTLHDEIIGALSEVAEAPADQFPDVRRTCLRAAHTTREFGLTLVPLHDLVDHICLDAPVRVDVSQPEAAIRVPLSGEVGAALAGAAREALRNVARHSGTRQATLRLSPLDRGIEVVVTDDGCGLPVGFRPGFGIGSSIQDRMASVGGTAQIRPRASGGTEVSLVWVPEPAAATPQVGGNLEANFPIWAGVPMAIAHFVLAWIHSWDSPMRWALLALSVLLLVLVSLSISRLRSATPGVREQFGWSLFAAGLIDVGLWLAGDGASASSESWMIGFAQLPLTLLAFFAKPSSLPILTVPPFVAVAVGVLIDPHVSFFEGLAAMQAAVIPAVIGMWCGVRVRRSLEAAQDLEATLLGIEIETLRQAAAREAKERHLRHTLAVTVPWLEQVGARSEPPDQDLRLTARLLAAEARDDLLYPSVWSEQLRHLVADFRRRGGSLILRGDVEANHRQFLESYLPAVLPELAGKHRVTVTANVADQSEVRITVIPGGDSIPTRVSHLDTHLHISVDADLTVVTARLSAPRTPLIGGLAAQGASN